MKEHQQYIRQNKNFLDRPMFALDEINANTLNHCWSPSEGFKLETDYKLPTKTDQVVLYYFILRSQELNWNTDLEFTKHELLKNCGIGANKKSYERLDDTLKRWSRIIVSFEGSFVCAAKGQIYKENAEFHILSHSSITPQKQPGRAKIRVILDKLWLEVIRTHSFFQILDFQVIKQLSAPLCLRLYEILSKNFYKRDTWQIDSLKLAAMIPLQVSYASDCVKKIKPLIAKINKASGAKIYSMTIRKPKHGVAILTFSKDTKANLEIPKLPFPGKPAPVPGYTSSSSAKINQLSIFEPEQYEFNAAAYLESLSKEDQEKLLAEFEKSLTPFNLKRYKQKGLDAMKTTFYNFCCKYAARQTAGELEQGEAEPDF